MAYRIDELPHSVWLRVESRPEGCWHYTYRLSTHGYARMTFRGVQWFVHRLVYALLVGPIPAGQVIDHLCLNRACCNPDHLEAVAPEENSRRVWNLAIRPGMLALQSERSASARRGKKPGPRPTHCPQGHLLDDDNTYVRPGTGAVECRICRRIAHQADWTKARSLPAEAAPSHCSEGHELTPENSYVRRGKVKCRTCRRAEGRRSDAKRRKLARERKKAD